MPPLIALSRPFRLVSVLALFLSIVVILPQTARSESAVVADLVSRAKALKLAESKEWLRLLHYEKRFDLVDRRSLIDDPKFFLSPTGARDPEAELAATLASFLEPAPPESTEDYQHPQCQFVARFHFLKTKLAITEGEIPTQPCPRFDKWIHELDPGSLTLIYPANYLNNPASMYGHTLLRVDPASYGTPGAILGYGIGYTAAVNYSEGLLFAVKGIFGGYKGFFTILPYYVQVGRYGDIEHRDIWEYRLSLSREESVRLLEHLWELREMMTDYYFFDENCSYLLLALLEVGRPELELTESFPLWTIPTDTVKVVLEQKGLVVDRQYRPSISSVIEARSKKTTPEVRSVAKELRSKLGASEKSHLKELSIDQQAAALDLATDLVQLDPGSDDAQRKKNEEHRFELLRERRDLPLLPPVQISEPAPPEAGHGSQRLSYKLGREGSRGFEELEYRPAYHDQLDNPVGFTSGAEVEFFRLAFRHPEEQEFQLERFTPVEIFSLSPRTEFSRSLSWRLDFGAVRRHIGSETSPAPYFEGGGGLAWNLGPAITTYGLLEASAEISEGYRENYSIGGGARLGLRVTLTDHLRFLAEGLARRYALGEDHSRFSLAGALQLDLSKNLALRAGIARTAEVHETHNEPSIALQGYF